MATNVLHAIPSKQLDHVVAQAAMHLRLATNISGNAQLVEIDKTFTFLKLESYLEVEGRSLDVDE